MSAEVANDGLDEEAVAEAVQRVQAGGAPALTLIQLVPDEAPLVQDLDEPRAAQGWVESEIEEGNLAAADPQRAITWVPGEVEALNAFSALFLLLRRLGYDQSFELGALAEDAEQAAALSAALSGLGAQASNDGQAAFLAASSEAAPNAADGLAAEDAAAGGETPDTADASDDGDGGRAAVVVFLCLLLLIGVVGGGFVYLAQKQAGSTEAAAENRAREAQAAYDEGVKARKRRSYARAEQQFRRALELQPKRGEAAAELGALLSEDMGRHEEALAVYEAFFRVAGEKASGILHFNRGNVLLRLRRFDDAVDAYNLAQEYLPIRARINKTAALIELGDLAEARRTLKPVLARPKSLKGAQRGQAVTLGRKLGLIR